MAEPLSGGSSEPIQTRDIAPSSLHVGPLTVRAEAAEVAAFAREAAAPLDGTVPFTFPMRWFAHPEIRAAGKKLVDGEAWILIHESQSFDYDRPLDADVDYRMSIEIIRELEPSRLILRAEIGDKDPCLRAEMVLRIIATDAAEPQA